MFKYIFFFLLWLNSCIPLICQGEKFSRSFSYGLRQAQAEILYEDENYYYAMGYAEDSIGPELGLHVTLHDKTNGDVIHNAYFELDSTWMFIGNNIRVHNVFDTLYFCATARGRVHLMAYAKQSREIFIKRSIINPFEGGTYTHDMVRENDRFLITFTADSDAGARPAIWLAWDDGRDELKIMDNNEKFNVAGKIIRLSNGNYLMATTWNPVAYKYTLNLSELDTNFNVLWTWSTEDWEKAFINSGLLQINEEEVLVLYRAEVPDQITLNRSWPHHFMRFNLKTRKAIWKKNVALPASSFQSYIGSMVKSQRDTGTILAVTNAWGENVRWHDSLILNGRVLKMDFNGKIIWKRDYTIYTIAPQIINTFHNIISTSDGNYLIGGNTDDKQIVAWLVKINEDGHILGDTTSSVQWEKEDWKSLITIYPNPVSDVLYINQEDIMDVGYSLVDMTGKEVARYTGQGAFQSTVWDIGHLAVGSYILSIKKEGVLMGSKMIIKIR
ncbi:MAG: T9SS type A sorting domain-containing protein [Saprospiraceae bacterium]|nr:T9SS type A sorting domain-containing protein [Saprospiraceae bacterium]